MFAKLSNEAQKAVLESADLQNFILQVRFIEPISKILSGLKNNTYRDCDVKYLDTRLNGFMEIATDLLGIKFEAHEPGYTYILNDLTRSKHIERFSTLLRFFEEMIVCK